MLPPDTHLGEEMPDQVRERLEVGLAMLEVDNGGLLGRSECSSAVSFRLWFHPHHLWEAKMALGNQGLAWLEEEDAELLSAKFAIFTI